MRSIWNNAFHSTPPALSWTYEVIFDELLKPIYGGAAGYDIPSRYLTEAVVSINIPDRETETESVYYGGLEFPLYTRHKNAGTFTIKFNENALYDASNALDILYSAYAFNKNYLYCKGGVNEEDEINGYSDGVYFGYSPTITVNIFDPSMVTLVQGATGALANEVIVRRIRFEDCKILSIGGFTLDYESTDTITREVTFSYAKMIDGYIPEDEEVESNDSNKEDGSPNEDARGDGSNEQKVADEQDRAVAIAAAAGQALAAARESEKARVKALAAQKGAEKAASDAEDAAVRAEEEAAWSASQEALNEAASQAAAAENVASEQANIAHEAASYASRQKASAYAASQRANKELAKLQEEIKVHEEEEAARKAAEVAYESERAASEAAANASKAMEAARAADAAYARSSEAAARAQAAASGARRR